MQNLHIGYSVSDFKLRVLGIYIDYSVYSTLAVYLLLSDMAVIHMLLIMLLIIILLDPSPAHPHS